LNEILKNQIFPEPETFSAIISYCNNHSLVDDAVEIFEILRDSASKANNEAYSQMIELYIRLGQPKKSIQLFWNMLDFPTPCDVKLCELMFRQFGSKKDWRKRVYRQKARLFDYMLQHKLIPNIDIYDEFLHASYIYLNQLPSSTLLVDTPALLPEKDLDKRETPTETAATIAHRDVGRISHIFRVLVESDLQANVATHKHLLRLMVFLPYSPDTENMFLRLVDKGLTVENEENYDAVLNMYLTIAEKPLVVNRLLEKMKELNYPLSLKSYTSLITMYKNSQNLNKSVALYNELKAKNLVPDILLYTAMIDVYGKLNDVKKAEALMKEMHRAGIAPNEIVINTIIHLYGQRGMLIEL
jgi:pentatricopeptide repeat protein